MNEPTQTIDLQLLYTNLPEPIKDIILAPETSETYDRLTQRFHLDPKQRDALSAQTTFFLMGLRNPQSLVTALTTELSIDHQNASLIAQELNRDIFYPIKEELKALYETTAPAQIPQTPPEKPEQSALIASTPAFSMGRATEKTPSTPVATTFASSENKTAIPPPPAPLSPPAKIITMTPPAPIIPQESPKAHIGNIFEEKLGGAFRVKSDAVEYSVPHEPTPAPKAVPIPTLAPVTPPAIPSVPVPPPVSAIPLATPAPLPPATPAVQVATPAQRPADPYRELPI